MNYMSINSCDLANGEGVRCSLFVSGCKFHCPGCFNPTAQCFEAGEHYGIDTMKEIVYNTDKPWCSGLSILGGDPMWQKEKGLRCLKNLCDCVHGQGKTVWLWTGFTWEDLIDPPLNMENSMFSARYALLKNVDILVDGQFIESQKDLSLRWRGSKNQRVIDVKKSLEKGEVVLYEKTY